MTLYGNTNWYQSRRTEAEQQDACDNVTKIYSTICWHLTTHVQNRPCSKYVTCSMASLEILASRDWGTNNYLRFVGPMVFINKIIVYVMLYWLNCCCYRMTYTIIVILFISSVGPMKCKLFVPTYQRICNTFGKSTIAHWTWGLLINCSKDGCH